MSKKDNRRRPDDQDYKVPDFDQRREEMRKQQERREAARNKREQY